IMTTRLALRRLFWLPEISWTCRLSGNRNGLRRLVPDHKRCLAGRDITGEEGKMANLVRDCGIGPSPCSELHRLFLQRQPIRGLGDSLKSRTAADRFLPERVG